MDRQAKKNYSQWYSALHGVHPPDILGGRVEFREEEIPTTDLLDGKIKFHTYLTPPVPAREIDNVLEFDPNYFSALFG